MIKKTYPLFLACAVALSLTACGGDGERSALSSVPEASAVESAAPEVSAAPVSAAEAAASSAEEPQEPVNLVYGTATLTYAEFYSGDVSSVDSYDAVSSATTSKHSILENMATDFVDETTNADGYHITGVKNVNIAIDEKDVEAYQAMNDSFVLSDTEPAQYKIVTMEDGVATYSATVFNIADTVTDAAAELQTGSVWGDYQINVTDGAVTHLRNTREDEGFDIGSNIQGIILETESGLKVGMEALQSIWVQPYEVSFNVLSDNTHNVHIAQFDNLPELSKLVGETVTKITYIVPDAAYIYEFDGIFIKPAYTESITSERSEDKIVLSTDDFSGFDNGALTVTYTIGQGRESTVYTLFEGALENGTDTYALDLSEVNGLEDQSGTYKAVISSDNYADVSVPMPATQEQKAALETLIAQAETALAADSGNETLAEHIGEAQELLENGSSDEINSIYSELSRMLSGSGEGGHH